MKLIGVTDLRLPFEPAVIRGIADYISDHNLDWIIHRYRGALQDFRRINRKRFALDGLVTYCLNPNDRDIGLSMRYPVVNLSSQLADLRGLPSVQVDHEEVGCLAARHFMDRGFRKILYLGLDMNVCRQHLLGLERVAQTTGVEIVPLTLPNVIREVRPKGPSADQAHPFFYNPETVRQCLEPHRGSGLFCCDDTLALRLSPVLRHLGYQVPFDFALLGCNDESLCYLDHPHRSSVCLPAHELGYETMRLMERLLSTPTTAPQVVRVPPTHVAARASSDCHRIDDPVVRRALDFMRANLLHGPPVDAVAAAAGVSRRLLEQRFRQHLNRGVLQHFTILRLERVRRLLRETSLPIEKVAELGGFTTGNRLSIVFKQHTGLSPRAFRLQRASQPLRSVPA